MKLASKLVFASLVAAWFALCGTQLCAATSFNSVLSDVLPKMVKIYGAGGVRGLEPYQSGFLISAEGHVLTSWSYVLDTDLVKVTLDDGRKYEGTSVGIDPRLEIAILKIDATELPHFDLANAPTAESGTRVLALSNLFGVATGEEPVSVQRGVVMARTRLDARRGAFETAYRGPVYVVDAMTNNPGAAGGALVNQRGELLGLLGKELRNAQNGSWLNYAVPVAELKPSIEAILAGKPRPKETEHKLSPEEAYNLAVLGVTLVPDVLEHTPPYIDDVRPNSPAAKAGLQRDDLVIFIDDTLVNSCRSVNDELSRRDRSDAVKWVVKRGQELVEAVMQGAE
jgi:S1-C subfamily serine protease